MDEEENSNVIWNFDDDEGKLIFLMKVEFINNRDNWDLENAYWSLLKLLSEAEPLFEDNIKEELNEEFNKISNIRKDCNKFIDLNEEEKGDCWNLLNLLYRKLCNEMVNKDLYFRRKKGYVGL